MTLKKAYYYLFYTFWRFFESNPLKWGTVWKAGASISVLETIFVCSILNYYNIFIDRKFNYEITSPELIIPIILIMITNYHFFSKNDNWMDYAEEFNVWPTEKNFKGGLFVLLFVIAILGSLFYSFYLMSNINWKRY
ncbi:hypothetical protein [Mucilaginibacter boryungensis]|uniref:Uncharacterized protein n=1 Tax=Mucilaginibacter boryungensis TaxID=768480 RepID=A0ABR9XMD7_9SPHI|nr:hypothetical protein [Mucilaginibacter boryungensis]MBE9668259.1 hypothetical protein [Mucilaginibacter boryungensis]